MPHHFSKRTTPELEARISKAPGWTFHQLDLEGDPGPKTRPCRIVIPCLEDCDEESLLSPLTSWLSKSQVEMIRLSLRAEHFKGQAHQSVRVAISAEPSITVNLIGLGKAKGAGFYRSAALRCVSSFFISAKAGMNPAYRLYLAHGKSEEQKDFVTALAMRFDNQLHYQSKRDKGKQWAKTIEVYSDHAKYHAQQTQTALLAVEAVHWSRDLATMPGNVLNPQSYCEEIKQLKALGVTIEVLDHEAMNKLGMFALLGVAQGSLFPPLTVIMRWQGKSSTTDIDVALVGKGVTFDSGGISLKPANKMEDMKYDMCGSALVCGEMMAIAKQKLACNVVGIVGLVENMPDGRAQRPGDVVKAASGKTIEIINTDAEGRLVLADLLWYVETHLKPRKTINFATLTGAMIVALGHHYGGMFSNDDALAEELLAASRQSGEPLWRLPLDRAYDEQINSEIADIKNTGGMPAGSITAAQFLKHFVNDTPWCHLDIAGVAWRGKAAGFYPAGATGYGVLLINRFLQAQCS